MSRTIKLPLVTRQQDWPEYIAREVGFLELNLKGKDRERFQQLHADLAAAAKFADGHPVVSKPDVLRWLLEQSSISYNPDVEGRKGREDRE